MKPPKNRMITRINTESLLELEVMYEQTNQCLSSLFLQLESFKSTLTNPFYQTTPLIEIQLKKIAEEIHTLTIRRHQLNKQLMEITEGENNIDQNLRQPKMYRRDNSGSTNK